jgi:ABC-2 type transport system ATP-binding protein
VKEVVAADDLGRRFGTVDALRGVTFAVDGPQVVGILGPNGAGKTTLLEILEGIREPTAGSFRLFGAPQSAAAYPRRRVGVVILAAADLGARARVPVERLSGGEAQRLFVAAAVVHEPDLVFLDEPTAHLDPENKAKMGEILRVMGRSRTVILTTHDLREAEAVCDHVVFLVAGRVRAAGPTAEIVAAVPPGERRGAGLEDAFFHLCAGRINAGGTLE